MNKTIIVILIFFIVIIASSGCTNSDNDQTTTTELNRTGSGSGSGSGSTESSGSSEGGSGSSSDGTYFDSGKVTLENGETYEWKSYQVNDKIVIYSTYTKEDGSTLKQTNTLEKSSESPETVNMITVVPKITGTSSWQHITGNQGYTNLLDYYWKHFRPNWLMEGPIH